VCFLAKLLLTSIYVNTGYKEKQYVIKKIVTNKTGFMDQSCKDVGEIIKHPEITFFS
jgi:hypothetical protein